MISSALSDTAPTPEELDAMREHLVAIRASLEKACRDMDDQIRAVEIMRAGSAHAATRVETSSFFDHAPELMPRVTPVLDTRDQHEGANVVLEATAPAQLDPDLEQATLEELNAALANAFAQIASRSQW